MIKHDTKTIQGLKFQLGMVPAMQSLESMPRVLALVGPAISSLKDAVTGGKVDPSKMLEVGTGIVTHLGKASPKELVEVAKILLAPCQVQEDGKWVDLLSVFDVMMQGRIFTVLNLIAWAVQLNYQDFFALLPDAKSGAGTASSSSTDQPTK